MKKCTETNNSVSVILATYNPKIEWFLELLQSLENQTYKNLSVLIVDDCSTTISNKELENLVGSKLKSTPYKILFNQKNLGSNKTFERLINEAETEYIAFCDQDDVWHSDKIEKSLNALIESKKDMVCSDLRVIDGNGNVTADSITKVRKRHNLHPQDQKEYLIYKNFVVGCTVLMKTETAKRALPFSDSFVHDHLLAIDCAFNNGIFVIDTPLIDYRIHGFNQTGVLTKVKDKQSYYTHRILDFNNKIDFLLNRYNDKQLTVAKSWANARIANYHKQKGSFKQLKKLQHVNKKETFFELFVLRNKLLFKIAVKLIQKGKI